MPIQWMPRGKPGRLGSFVTHGGLLVLCAALMIVGKADITVMNSARSILTGLVAPVADAIAVPFRAADALLEGAAGVANLREENELLKQNIADLRQYRRSAELLQSENRQLKSVNGVILPPDSRPVSARVVAVNGSSFAHSVMVNTGSNDGIRKGHAVTTTEGLVGMVVDTGPKHAQILLVTDINAMVPVILNESSWQAATEGTNGRDLRLRFLPSPAEIKVGELVQTSGHGGVLPPGIPVGRIKSVNEDRSSIVVTPAADLRRLVFVTILVGDDNPGYAIDDIFNQRISPQGILQDAPEEAAEDAAEDEADDADTGDADTGDAINNGGGN